jgi:hypothetical protein
LNPPGRSRVQGSGLRVPRSAGNGNEQPDKKVVSARPRILYRRLFNGRTPADCVRRGLVAPEARVRVPHSACCNLPKML